MNRGMPQGYIFGDNGADRSFESPDDMKAWFNQRLEVFPRLKPTAQNVTAKVTFDPQSFNLCHTDLAPRRIIMARNGSLYLIDWAFAGIYPSIFEIFALRTRLAFDPIFRLILGNMSPRSAEDEQQLELLSRIQYVQTVCGDTLSTVQKQDHDSHNSGDQRKEPLIS